MDTWQEFYGVPASSWRWSQTGIVFNLSRRWTRYIFIYYLPSALCVVASWASFLINPQVSDFNKYSIMMLMLGCSWPYVPPSHTLPLPDHPPGVHHHLQPPCGCWHHCPHCLDHHSIHLHHCCYHCLCSPLSLHQVYTWSGEGEDQHC